MQVIKVGNRQYFTDGKYLYFKSFKWVWAKCVEYYDEVPKVDGIYLKRHQKILTLLTKKNR